MRSLADRAALLPGRTGATAAALVAAATVMIARVELQQIPLQP
jgi:hypothetical protein